MSGSTRNVWLHDMRKLFNFSSGEFTLSCCGFGGVAGGCEVDFGIPQGLGQGCTEGPKLLGYQPLCGPQTGHHCSAPLYFAHPHCLHQVCCWAHCLMGLDLHWAPRGLQCCYGARDSLGCALQHGMGRQGLGG